MGFCNDHLSTQITERQGAAMGSVFHLRHIFQILLKVEILCQGFLKHRLQQICSNKTTNMLKQKQQNKQKDKSNNQTTNQKTRKVERHSTHQSFLHTCMDETSWTCCWFSLFTRRSSFSFIWLIAQCTDLKRFPRSMSEKNFQQVSITDSNFELNAFK